MQNWNSARQNLNNLDNMEDFVSSEAFFVVLKVVGRVGQSYPSEQKTAV